MQYQDAMTELRTFASEPLDMATVNPGKIAEIRMATRALLKALDSRSHHVFHEIRDHEAKKRVNPTHHSPPKQESLRVRIVDYIRIQGKATEMEVYRKFRITIKEMMKQIADSYGIVSYTKEKCDDDSSVVFYFLAETGKDFRKKYDAKAPDGHVVVGGMY